MADISYLAERNWIFLKVQMWKKWIKIISKILLQLVKVEKWKICYKQYKPVFFFVWT